MKSSGRLAGWQLVVSGMKTMSNRKLIRRTFLAAALTMSGAHATTASGFQQGQYQPGQPGQQIPQGNSTVTQELNRMFQESGQQMPSMNAKELPNANVPTQGQVRLRQTTNPPQVNKNSATHAQSPQNGSSGKQSALGRFFGKLRGDTGNNNPDYHPPVPPDDKPAVQSTATTGNIHQQPQVQNSSPQQGQLSQNPQNRPHQGQNPQNAPRSETVQASHANKRPMTQAAQGSNQSSGQVHNGAATSLPPRSGATVRPANPEGAASASPYAAGERSEYTQPGSAPGFMSTAGVAKAIQKQPAAAPTSRDKFQDEFIRENTGGTTGARQRAGASTPEVTVKKTAADEFESPFKESAASESGEPLDLDSLIDIPPATPQPVTAVAKKTNTLEQKTSEATRAAEKSAVSASEFAESNAVKKALEETVPEAAAVESTTAPQENPFTGVQLNTSDAQFFDSQGPTSGADVGSFGVPVAPMEDFNSNLPAIDLPSVDLPPINSEDASIGMEMNGAQSAESMQPAADATHMESTAPADTSARAELQPRLEDSEAMSADVPEAMSAAETARLRQAAEQERRQLQQRQIQARAGQTGFKGFCPVALRERRELVESSNQFASTFGLQTYTFSCAESKAAFDTDPSRYAPAAGGSDVVVLVNSGEEEAGQLDYALWYRDRLYLFRSRETMTLFSKEPQRFASQY